MRKIDCPKLILKTNSDSFLAIFFLNKRTNNINLKKFKSEKGARKFLATLSEDQLREVTEVIHGTGYARFDFFKGWI